MRTSGTGAAAVTVRHRLCVPLHEGFKKDGKDCRLRRAVRMIEFTAFMRLGGFVRSAGLVMLVVAGMVSPIQA
jgi:hypothetical protein